jgi:GAF domain-containing protein
VVHAQGWPDDRALEVRAVPLDAPALVAEAFRIQTAIWVSSEEALRASYPSAAEAPRRLGDEAWAAVPLRVDARTIGAIELGFPRSRELDGEERRFVLAVAHLVAQALERARLRDG